MAFIATAVVVVITNFVNVRVDGDLLAALFRVLFLAMVGSCRYQAVVVGSDRGIDALRALDCNNTTRHVALAV